MTIRKNGIKVSKIHYPDAEKGVFCMPVIQDFYATHQWVREIIRWNKKNILGAYFRVPDTQEVWYGQYNKGHKKGLASEATAFFTRSENQPGFQVIISRNILPSEILRIKHLPSLGWRFSPSSKGYKPCLCPACIARGMYGNRKLLKQKLSMLEHDMRHTANLTEQANILKQMNDLITDHRLHLTSWPELIRSSCLSDERVFHALGSLLLSLNKTHALNAFLDLLKNSSDSMKAWGASEIMYKCGNEGLFLLGPMLDIPEVMDKVREYQDWMAEE